MRRLRRWILRLFAVDPIVDPETARARAALQRAHERNRRA